jgi:hypothetical protein
LLDFGITEFGQALFNPAVKLLTENTDPTTATWIKESAFIDGTECPADKRYNLATMTFLNVINSPLTQ